MKQDNNFIIYDKTGEYLGQLREDDDVYYDLYSNRYDDDYNLLSIGMIKNKKNISKIKRSFDDGVGKLILHLKNNKNKIVYNKNIIKKLPLYVFGPLNSPTGYGSIINGFCREIEYLGENIKLINSVTYFNTNQNNVSLSFHHPYFLNMKSTYKILYTMLEGYTIPKFYLKAMDGCYDKFIVPTDFVKNIFSKYIEENRIITIPPGINNVFNPEIEKNQKVYFKQIDYKRQFAEITNLKPSGFKFVFSGRLCHRKGYDLVIRAYLEEFTKKDDVSLIIFSLPELNHLYTKEFHEKIFPICSQYYKDNSPPMFLFDDITDGKYNTALYCSWADCFVYPSRGEGLGLHPLEAAACKIPLICSNNSGMSDYINDDRALVIDTDKVESIGTKFISGKYSGNYPGWGNDGFYSFMEDAEYAILESPKVIEQLRAHMRYMYENHNSQSTISRVENMYNFISEKYDWDKSRSMLSDFLSDILQ